MINEMDKIQEKLDLLVEGFLPTLCADPDFDKGLIGHGLEHRERYKYWEWTQGVGLYGIWGLYSKTGEEKYLKILTDYYDSALENGLPGKNVNTMAPILALSLLAEKTGREDYMATAREWVEWLYGGGLEKTEEGGYQHRTTDDLNDQELWDDTLMMSVLPLATLGRILGKKEWMDEAEYQLLLHIEHLADPVTGLWWHGYTFKGRHHFAEAFWGRGNSWATIALPLFVETIPLSPAVKRYVSVVMNRQIEAVAKLQDASGLWHTLLDHEDSYLESSCAAGFGYGILKGIKLGLVDPKWKTVADKALPAVMDCIDGKGIVRKCSGGTPMGRESLDHYRNIPVHPMPYGQAMAMLFLMEAQG